MTNRKKRARSFLEMISKSVGIIAGIVSVIKTITEADPWVGGFLGTLTFYIGSIVLGIYIAFFSVLALLIGLFEVEDDGILQVGLAVSVIVGIVLGIYLGSQSLHVLDTIGLTFMRIVGVAALLVSIYAVVRHFSVDSKGNGSDS